MSIMIDYDNYDIRSVNKKIKFNHLNQKFTHQETQFQKDVKETKLIKA